MSLYEICFYKHNLKLLSFFVNRNEQWAVIHNGYAYAFNHFISSSIILLRVKV